MEFKRSFKISTIIIIQNLKNRDLKTGFNLFEDLQLQSAILEKKEIGVEFHEPKTAIEFVNLLRSIATRCVSQGLIPWLHLEIHGYRQGLVFGENEDLLPWKIVRKEFTAINKVTDFNLFISLAVCYGAWIMTELLEISLPSPFMGFIGSQKSESAGEISKIFSAFYLKFLESWDISVTQTFIHKKFIGSGFRVYFSESLFFESYALYLRKELTKKALADRWEDAVKRGNIRGNRKLIRKKRRHFLKMATDDDLNRNHFNKTRDSFFSITSNNEQQLSVTYEIMKSWSKKLQ